MNIVEEINKGEMERISQERPIPEFAPGDTLSMQPSLHAAGMYEPEQVPVRDQAPRPARNEPAAAPSPVPV